MRLYLEMIIMAMAAEQAMGYLRVCYYTNWSQYRPKGGKYTPDRIDPNLCTHIVFAFAKLEGNKLVPYEWNDDSTEWSTGSYAKINNLKQQNPRLKTLLAVGGWNAESLPFSDMARTAADRAEFVNTSVGFLRSRGFDGLDMDWEYPAKRGGRAEDKQNLILLLNELRLAFDKEASNTGSERLLLTAAVPAGKSNIDAGYDVPRIARVLDFINLMAYDLHGSWESKTGHNSPLFARSGESAAERLLNMDWAANYWVQQGTPKEKLIIGLGTYGRSFRLASRSHSGIGAAAIGAGRAGNYTREAGFMSYYEICQMLQNGATRVWNAEQKVPYLVKDNLWVGYDDVESIKEKIRWLKQGGFGGAMVWSIALDDFSGEFCGKGPYPLLRAINLELGDSFTASPNGRTTTSINADVAKAVIYSPSVTPVVRPSQMPSFKLPTLLEPPISIVPPSSSIDVLPPIFIPSFDIETSVESPQMSSIPVPVKLPAREKLSNQFPKPQLQKFNKFPPVIIPVANTYTAINLELGDSFTASSNGRTTTSVYADVAKAVIYSPSVTPVVRPSQMPSIKLPTLLEPPISIVQPSSSIDVLPPIFIPSFDIETSVEKSPQMSSIPVPVKSPAREKLSTQFPKPQLQKFNKLPPVIIPVANTYTAPLLPQNIRVNRRDSFKTDTVKPPNGIFVDIPVPPPFNVPRGVLSKISASEAIQTNPISQTSSVPTTSELNIVHNRKPKPTSSTTLSADSVLPHAIHIDFGSAMLPPDFTNLMPTLFNDVPPTSINTHVLTIPSVIPKRKTVISPPTIKQKIRKPESSPIPKESLTSKSLKKLNLIRLPEKSDTTNSRNSRLNIAFSMSGNRQHSAQKTKTINVKSIRTGTGMIPVNRMVTPGKATQTFARNTSPTNSDIIEKTLAFGPVNNYIPNVAPIDSTHSIRLTPDTPQIISLLDRMTQGIPFSVPTATTTNITPSKTRHSANSQPTPTVQAEYRLPKLTHKYRIHIVYV